MMRNRLFPLGVRSHLSATGPWPYRPSDSAPQMVVRD